MLKYLKAGSAYLLDRTLAWRPRRAWRRHVARKRLASWESQAGERDHLEASVERGVRMRLWFDSQLCRVVYCEDFEREERRFLNRYLKQGDVFVDVGANIGIYALIAARRVGSTGHVYAFEPCSETYERLVTNIELNGLANVSHYRLALSDRAAETQMTISVDGFDAFNSLARPVMGKELRLETVTCTTWDSFAVGHGLIGRVTMMKIDVEGWESRVLRGGYDALRRTDAPVLQVEFFDEACVSAGSSCNAVYRLLEELGYQIFAYNSRNNTIVPVPLGQTDPYLNLIAAKQPEEVVARLRRRSCSPWFRRALGRSQGGRCTVPS